MGKKRVLELTVDVLRDQRVAKGKYLLLEALLKSSDLEKGLTYSDLAELMGIDDPSLNDSSKQKIKRHLNGLKELCKVQSLAIGKKLTESGIDQVLSIENIQKGGGSGNAALFGITMQPIDGEDHAILSTGIKPAQDSAIVYSLEQLETLPIWAKPFQRIKLLGWNKALFIGAPLLIGLGYIPIAITLIEMSAWLLLISLTLVIGLIYQIFKPFYEVLDHGVIKAPQWLLPLKMLHALIITKQSETGKELILTQYKGLCPICDGQVQIVNGTYEFKGRLIGQCDRSGREHIYSFDHITKVGFPLREPGYSKLLKSSRLSE